VSVFAIAVSGSLFPVACGAPASNCTTGMGPDGVAVSPNGHFLYVTNGSSDTVSVFSIAADGSLSPVVCPAAPTYCNTATGPGPVAVSPDGRFLYVINFNSNTVSVFAIASNGSLSAFPACAGTCSTGMGPDGVAVSPGGHFLYVTNFHSNTVRCFRSPPKGSCRQLAARGATARPATNRGGWR
jgi:6-phosphogluconolactonase (cycloisomerase 2 family)